MNIIDENLIESQCYLLYCWHIHFKQIGFETGTQGLKDEEIIPYLLRLSCPTFFTRDDGFFNKKLCHPKYCLVYLAVKKDEAAIFIRRFLKHREFDTKNKRMGTIIRVSHTGLSVFRDRIEKAIHFDWDK